MADIEVRKSKVIVINRIFSGDFLSQGENLGHEIVNIFKSDPIKEEHNGKYYIYLMSDGNIPYEHQGEDIDAMFMGHGEGKHAMELTSMASGLQSILKVDLKGFREGQKEINFLFLELLSKEYLPEILQEEQQQQFETYKKWILTSAFLDYKKQKEGFNKTDLEELEKAYNALKDLANSISKKGINKSKRESLSKFVSQGYLAKAILWRAEHIHQLYYIIENQIYYGGIRLDKLFQNNNENKYGMSIYVTYTAKTHCKVEEQNEFFKKSYYLIDKNTRELEGIQTGRDAVSPQSSATYYYSDDTVFDEIVSLKKDFNDPVGHYEESDVDDTFSFMTITRKEYDELAYSNLFAYFFEKYPQLLQKIVNEKEKERNLQIHTVNAESSRKLKDSKQEQDLESSQDIEAEGKSESTKCLYREKKNIDILIVGDDYTIVIENKVKSKLNGLKYDANNQVFSTQLDKYKSWVEKEYPNFQHIYWIFAPEYNKIDEKYRKDYKLITYTDLHEWFKSEKGVCNEDKYFDDFLKALLYHKGNDNHFEEVNRKRLKNLIGNL